MPRTTPQTRRTATHSAATATATATVSELIEGRTMYSAAPVPQAVGCVPDGGSGTTDIVQDLNASGWDGLTQANDFAVQPSAGDTMPAEPAGLSTLVSAGHAGGVKVNVVLGAGGTLTTVLVSAAGRYRYVRYLAPSRQRRRHRRAVGFRVPSSTFKVM